MARSIRRTVSAFTRGPPARACCSAAISKAVISKAAIPEAAIPKPTRPGRRYKSASLTGRSRR